MKNDYAAHDHALAVQDRRYVVFNIEFLFIFVDKDTGPIKRNKQDICI
jgi:hypothetical protein